MTLLKILKNYVFCDVLLKNVKDKVVSFLLDRNMGKDFHVLKSEVTRTTFLKVTGR